jgi:hypothetical protein
MFFYRNFSLLLAVSILLMNQAFSMDLRNIDLPSVTPPDSNPSNQPNQSKLSACKKQILNGITSSYNHALDHPRVSLFCLGALATFTAYMAYQNTTIKKSVNTRVEKIRDYIITRIVCPAYIKWEMIKEDGITKQDVAYTAGWAGALMGTAYVCKKADDTFDIVKTGKGWLTDLYTYCSNCGTAAWTYIKGNPKTAKLTLVGVTGLLAALKCYSLILADKRHSLKLIDGFLNTLRDDQRLSINQSSELSYLVNQAKDNPTVLLGDEPFLSLLTPEQQKHLEQVISYYQQDMETLAIAYHQ